MKIHYENFSCIVRQTEGALQSLQVFSLQNVHLKTTDEPLLSECHHKRLLLSESCPIQSTSLLY